MIRATTNFARAAVRWLGVALVAAGAFACNNDDPFVTYIGVVDATPPRLGRPLTASPVDDAGVPDGASADQNTGPPEEITDGSAPSDDAEGESSLDSPSD